MILIRALEKPDINGKPVYTLWKWIAESQWVGDFAKAHPELTFINATEGGIGFPGIRNMPLSEAVDAYLSKNFELHSRLHGEIQNNRLSQVSKEEIVGLLIQLNESLERSQGNLEILISETDKIISSIHREKQVPNILQSGMAALAEIELSEEVAYRNILNMFNVIFSKVLNKDVRQISRNLEELSDSERAQQKLIINNKKLVFLRDVARANIALLNHTLANYL